MNEPILSMCFFKLLIKSFCYVHTLVFIIKQFKNKFKLISNIINNVQYVNVIQFKKDNVIKRHLLILTLPQNIKL